jgi:hypothetical protein
VNVHDTSTVVFVIFVKLMVPNTPVGGVGTGGTGAQLHTYPVGTRGF